MSQPIPYINHDNVVFNEQMLSGALDHFVVKTPNSIIPTADPVTAQSDYYEQSHVWVELINQIRLRANVVIVGNLTAAGFPFAVERKDAVTATELQSLIQALGAVAFGGTATVDLSGVTVEETGYVLYDGTVGIG